MKERGNREEEHILNNSLLTSLSYVDTCGRGQELLFFCKISECPLCGASTLLVRTKSVGEYI